MMNRTHTALIGTSEAMQRVRAEAELAARTNGSVLIEGETGCGKELVAQLIHELSRRPGKIVCVNVAAIADTMFEAQLFGHRRGAFTGAISDQVGLVKEAHHGTLFLDEISSLALTAQAKLLRVLETGYVRMLGGRGEEHVDFRVVAASNADLALEAREGRFRPDLYHRLCDWRIQLPPLRDRREDIALLAEHFLSDLRTSGSSAVFHEDAISALMAQYWPGNVRQLRQTIRRASYLSDGEFITRATIVNALAHGTPPYGIPAIVPQRITEEVSAFLKILESVNWDTMAAAAQLGVTRKTIYSRLQKHRLEIPGKHQRRVFQEVFESGAA
jgi:DNA-binding NtrC family response regulator